MKFIETIKSVWKIEELRNRILLTLGFLLVYRFGAQIVLPGIDAEQLANLATQTDGGLLGLLNAFTGGAFSNASIFALGIMPYISASIVVQLMGIAVPYLQKLQKDGESGRKKLDQITRWLTILITLVQGPGYIINLFHTLPESAFMMDSQFMFITSSVIILTTGCIFAMWMGERITENGVGNGISLLIMVGIIARLPASFIQEFSSRFNESGGLIMVLIELAIWFIITLASVYLVMAIRKVPVQYARRNAGGGYERSVGGARQFIPLKLNASGVMPIIFAQAIMFVPAALAGLSDSDWALTMKTAFENLFGFWYNLVFGILVIIFTYFYTAVTVPTNKMADDLKRSGGFIPGIRPGTDTDNFLDKVMSQITLPGSIFLALLSVFPAFIVNIGVQDGWALFYGGTSLLIMVGVAIDTMQQVDSYLLNRHYDSLIKTGRNRKAVA